MTTGTAVDRRKELRVAAGYFDQAIDDIGQLLEDAREVLEDIEFDTLVATGLSGTVVAPILAHELGVNFFIVRKPDDLSTHSYKRAVGHIGRRWVFLDDFIDTGRTLTRVRKQVAEVVANEAEWAYDEAQNTMVELPTWTTGFVGVYEYQRTQFLPAEDFDAAVDGE